MKIRKYIGRKMFLRSIKNIYDTRIRSSKHINIQLKNSFPEKRVLCYAGPEFPFRDPWISSGQ